MNTGRKRPPPQVYGQLSTAMAGTLGILPAPMLTQRDTERDNFEESPIGWEAVVCRTLDGVLIPNAQEERVHPVWVDIDALGQPVPAAGGLVLDNHLAFVFDAGREDAVRLLVKSDTQLSQSLNELLVKGEQPTKAELRVLKQLLCGIGLSVAARADGVGHETKRSQYKSLARKLGVRSQAELSSRVLAHTLFERRTEASPPPAVHDDVFVDLIEAFLPAARAARLRSRDGEWHRFIDIGPVSGHPVILLHSQILPDIRLEDVALLEAAGIRLVVPLRHGAMAGPVDRLDIATHLDHACDGIDLARSHFCGDKADLLFCVSGCAYGIEYAKRTPERVRSVGFLGACIKPSTGLGVAGRLRAGLLSLASSHWGLLSNVLDFYGARLEDPAALRRFFVRHYSDCVADLAVVEAEYAQPHQGERARQMFMASLQSIKHDFYHQANPRWDCFPSGQFRAAFFHGAEDFIHQPGAVKNLARRYGDLPVHFIPGAGQLLYYDHFGPMLDAYAGFLESLKT